MIKTAEEPALTPRYLLYRVLEPLGPYIVGTWEVIGQHPTILLLRRSMKLTDGTLIAQIP